MTTKVRWLKWNGVYDLAGICNQPLIPLNSVAEQNKAIKQRLYLLGFNCGALDNTMNAETQKALRTFNGYWNHPTIHRLVDPVTLPPNVPPPLNAPFFNQATIDCLGEIEDEHQSEQTPPPVVVNQPNIIAVARNRIGRLGFGTTINTSTPLAVKIISTPETIVPFAEYGGVKIEIKGFERIKSLLFRVYRNFDANSDRIEVAGERLVYQEILDREGILGLLDKGPKNNVGKHHEAKAFIMKNEVTGGFGGFFNSSLGVALDKLHAPYKIRVWVSTVADEFNRFIFNPTNAIPSSRRIHDEATNLHYLDINQRGNVRRGRAANLTPVQLATDTTYRDEPEINYMNSVHDKSNLGNIDQDESPQVRNYWNQFVNWNGALSQRKFWTNGDAAEVNLIETPCQVPHDARFLRDNQIQIEAFIQTFADDPVGTYWGLRDKLDRDGENFLFPEMAELFDNIECHINIIKRRLCCGQWKFLSDTIKNDVLPFIENTVLPEFNQIKNDGFPYNRAIEFCEKFMSLFSYIVHEAVVKPELKFFIKYNLNSANEPAPALTDILSFSTWLRNRRNRVDGCRSTAHSEYGVNVEHTYHTTQNDAIKSYVIHHQGRNSYPKMKQEVAATQGVRQIGKPILIPSYNPLDPYFFVKIRAVPMYAVGMIDMQYLNADGIRQIPVGFFEHDIFHVCTPQTGTQQWKTLYARLCQAIDANPMNNPNINVETLVNVKWQENIEAIIQDIDQHAGAQKDAYSFLMFWLLHEPKTGILNPSIPEQTSLNTRLAHNNSAVIGAIQQEDSVDFFGDYSHPFMQHLNWAATQYRNLSVHLEDTI